jgi:hypothetical protein
MRGSVKCSNGAWCDTRSPELDQIRLLIVRRQRSFSPWREVWHQGGVLWRFAEHHRLAMQLSLPNGRFKQRHWLFI